MDTDSKDVRKHIRAIEPSMNCKNVIVTMTTNPSRETDSKDVHKHMRLHWYKLKFLKRLRHHDYEPLYGNLILIEALLSLPSLFALKGM